jgi:hypothetical protein
MKNLLLAYSFVSKEEYFYMISDSYTNGQYLQAHNQIKELPKKGKKDFLLFLTAGGTPDMPHENKIWCIKHTIEVI